MLPQTPSQIHDHSSKCYCYIHTYMHTHISNLLSPFNVVHVYMYLEPCRLDNLSGQSSVVGNGSSSLICLYLLLARQLQVRPREIPQSVG